MHVQGSPQRNARQPAPPPVEDIEAVLGRFQAWTDTHHRKPRQTHSRAEEKARNAAPVKSGEDGLREISYEEALKAVRHRRTPMVHSVPVTAPRKEGVTPAAPVQTVETRGGLESSQPTQPDFRQALAASLADSGIVVCGPAIEVSAPQPAAALALARIARPAVVSVRLAMDERERFKMRAAEAGLSVSAYMRECALEVEQLRAQVVLMQVRQRMEIAPECGAGSAAANLPVPGLWGWVRQRISRKPFAGLVLRA
jgi:hypothetical protein